MKKTLGTLAFVGLLSIMFLPGGAIHEISTVEIVLMVPAILGFPIFYTYAFPWWSTRMGRALFIFAFGMAELVSVSVLYMIFGDDYFLREQVRFVVFSTILIGIYYQLWVMVQTYRESPNREYRKMHRAQRRDAKTRSKHS